MLMMLMLRVETLDAKDMTPTVRVETHHCSSAVKKSLSKGGDT
jgi:hypothetical protein